jgi:hypothetical protein
MDDLNDNFENDCLTELGNREAWEDSPYWGDFGDHDDDRDCGDENDIEDEEEDTQ